MNEVFYSFDQIIYKIVGSWMRELEAHEGMHVEVPVGVPAGMRQVVGARVLRGVNVEGKRAYYAMLVGDECKRFLKALQREMGDAFTECEKSFVVHGALNLVAHNMERTASLISDHPRGGEADIYAVEREAILQVLKCVMIRLYLEVQEQYKGYVRRNVLSLEDIHRGLFGEDVPVVCCGVDKNVECLDEGGRAVKGEGQVRGTRDEIRGEGRVRGTGDEVDRVAVNEPVGVVNEPVAGYGGKEFEAVMGDVRPGVEGVLGYEDIVGNKAKFAQLEMELFEHELIDADYRFKRKPHGNVMKMAAVYWVAYQKGYFQKYHFKERRRSSVTANDVRAFFNHRYHTNIDREFRNFKDDDVLDAFLKRSAVWISIIGKY